MSHLQENTKIRLEIDSHQLLKLMRQRQLVASDFRCCDSKSRCIIKQLLLACTAESVTRQSPE